MFSDNGRINTPMKDGLEPSAFISAHVEASPYRSHKIMDVLISEKGDSAAVYFQFTSKSEAGDNPTYEGIDYFLFDLDGKFSSLSIFCDTRPSRR